MLEVLSLADVVAMDPVLQILIHIASPAIWSRPLDAVCRIMQAGINPTSGGADNSFWQKRQYG